MVQGGSSPKTLISADVADPPGEPILFIEGASADFDHDGIDDVAFRFTLESSRPPFESGPKVSAVFRWFDRPAGLSRDPEAPDTDLRALVSGVLSKAGRPKEAPGVIQLLQQVRALYSAICSEGGGPRLTGVPAVGTLSCGPSRALEEGGVAEVRAYATVGDPLRTIAAFDRLQRPPSPKTPAKSTEALHYVALAAPSSVAKEVKTLTVRPRLEKGRVPSWGSLAFDAEGRLLVRSVLGVVRVDPLSGEEQRADDVPAWPTEVVSPDGTLRWIEAYNPCHGPALHATVGPADGAAGDEIFDVALPVHWPIGMRCASAKGEPVAALPLAWGPKGLEAIVAGEPVLVATGFAQATPSRGLPEGPYGLGAPRSPDGQVVAVPTSQGVLVRGAKTRMYRGRDFDSGQELRDCAVSNDMTRVACVRAGRVVWGQWDPP
jgi:hypothetical protein